jgi:hypothetical protein
MLRAGLPVKVGNRRDAGRTTFQRRPVNGARGDLGAEKKGCADLYTGGTEIQGCSDSSGVRDAAGSNYRNSHRPHQLRGRPRGQALQTGS